MIRRTVELGATPKNPAFYLYHDDDAVVFLNGQKVAEFKGYTTDYKVVALDETAGAAVKQGANLLAVHCNQGDGGQAIDVHLIEADNVPKLTPGESPKAPEPFKSDLSTEWGAKVTAENTWREYPRPALARDQWTNLNGHWNYAITAATAPRPDKWEGEILVPFPVESKLSGVQRLLREDQAIWYFHSIEGTNTADSGQRVLLHFEASDYQPHVWINETEVGSHTGGNTPFTFDITETLTDGDDVLYVRVLDSTSGFQLRGKQTAHPRGIFYTQVSGIWGTVWTESVPEKYIERLHISTKTDGTVTVEVHGPAKEADTTVVATLGNEEIAKATGKGSLTFKIADPQLWSPESPTLYQLVVTSGTDSVKSYVGVRQVGRVKDADGHWRFTLNGKVYFHWGPLDQG